MTPKRPLPFAEFVALIALMFSLMAFSIDAMLPALPQMARELAASRPNDIQLVIAVFFAASGVGQLIAGPLSDALGRRPVIIGGIVLYMFGAVLAWAAPTLTLLLIARMLQGLAMSAPRTVSMALVRDLYAGRQMARVMSLSMMLFVLVPAVAPMLGQVIIQGFGWRAIFLAFIVFAGIAMAWFGLRQPETLPAERRRRLAWSSYTHAFALFFGNRAAVTYTLVLGFAFTPLIVYISTVSQIFGDTFGRGDQFPYYFAAIALASGSSSILNAQLVERLGMRLLASVSFAAQVGLCAVVLALWYILGDAGDARFWLFMGWSTLMFLSIGMVFGNLNALAMEPMGEIAGFAAALIGAVSTVLAVILAVPIGAAYAGTPVPIMVGALVMGGLSLAGLWLAERQRG